MCQGILGVVSLKLEGSRVEVSRHFMFFFLIPFYSPVSLGDMVENKLFVLYE